MKALFCILALVSVLSATAQQDTTADAMQQVVVTAQRRAYQSFFIPYSVQMLSAQHIERFGPRTTPEALMAINGVFVQKTNHGGGSAFVRGLTGNQTLMLVDGIRLNNSTFRFGPNQYLNTISPFSIRRIEVAKGTGSVQYGSDAIGGTIHVITVDPQFAKNRVVHGKAVGRYVTGDMEKTVNAGAEYSAPRFAAMTNISYRDFDDLRGGDSTGVQVPSGYKEWTADAKMKFAVTSNAQLTVAHQFVQQRHVPVYHKVVLENFAINEFESQRRMLTYARMNIAGSKKWAKELQFTASWQHTLEGRSSRKNGSNVLRKETDKISTLGFTVDLHSNIAKNWQANSGLDLYVDKVHSITNELRLDNNTNVQKRGLYPDGAAYGTYSLYSIHHFEFGKWLIDAGARFNMFNIRVPDTTLGVTVLRPSAWVGNIGVLYKLSGNHHIYTSFSSGYRAPNIDDMGTLGIVDFRYEVPAMQLEPEKSKHIELGYKFRSQKVQASIAAYYLHLEDIITRIKVNDHYINGYQVYKKENSERAYISGIEAELCWQFVKMFQVSGGIAYARGQNATRHEPLRRVPPMNGRILLNYQRSGWHGAVEVLTAKSQKRLAQGDKDDNRIPKGGTPGWTVMNIYGGYEWRQVSVNLSVQNIFNEDYRTHGSGINGMGRAAVLTIDYHF